MRMTRLHAPTLKEDAEVASHRLLLRAGYIRKLAAGIYDYLPLAQRVLRKIQSIVCEEMNRAGAPVPNSRVLSYWASPYGLR